MECSWQYVLTMRHIWWCLFVYLHRIDMLLLILMIKCRISRCNHFNFIHSLLEQCKQFQAINHFAEHDDQIHTPCRKCIWNINVFIFAQNHIHCAMHTKKNAINSLKVLRMPKALTAHRCVSFDLSARVFNTQRTKIMEKLHTQKIVRFFSLYRHQTKISSIWTKCC